MHDSKVLLCTLGRTPMITIGSALRDAGFVVLPARYHELGVDSLVRVAPDLALVQLGHEALESREFSETAEAMGIRVYCFATAGEPALEAAELNRDDFPYPTLQHRGDACELAMQLREWHTARRHPATTRETQQRFVVVL